MITIATAQDAFEQDLEDLRNELGIQAVREGAFSWYSNQEIAAALG